MNNNNYDIIIITHDIESSLETKNSLLPLNSRFFIGKNYESFSKLVNHAIVSAENEIVIICSYKVRPTPDDINRMLNYINDGYGFVALFRFAFFGCKKELFRRIGFMDERFIGGQYEDDDFYRRLALNNISYIEEESVIYIPKQTLWDTSYTQQFFQKKWRHKDINYIYKLDESKIIFKLLPEENYDYNIGKSDKNIIFKDRTYTRSFNLERNYFFKNVQIILDYDNFLEIIIDKNTNLLDIQKQIIESNKNIYIKIDKNTNLLDIQRLIIESNKKINIKIDKNSFINNLKEINTFYKCMKKGYCYKNSNIKINILPNIKFF
jgi:hypothetical protein